MTLLRGKAGAVTVSLIGFLISFGEVTVTAGEKDYRLTHLLDYDLTKLSAVPDQHAEAWKTIAPDLSSEEAAKAWGWFINDSYWLLVPSKLMDEGVNRELDDQGRLVLTWQFGTTSDDMASDLAILLERSTT